MLNLRMLLAIHARVCPACRERLKNIKTCILARHVEGKTKNVGSQE